MSEWDDPIVRLLSPQVAQSRHQLIFGLVTGKVARIEDDGTYHLRIFGINGQDGDPMSEARARVAMPMAGARRGIHFFPEVGDEVLVGFLFGQTTSPIILGALWNDNDPPPAQARQSAANDVRTVVSRSGHELTFDDTSGAEKVTLKTHAGHTIEMNDANGSLRISITSKLGHSIQLDDGPPGRISIQGPGGQVVLNDAGSLSIQATTSISLSAPSISLGGGVVAVGAAPGQASIDGQPFATHLHAATMPAPPPSTSGPVSP
jgi:hypothetical protein